MVSAKTSRKSEYRRRHGFGEKLRKVLMHKIQIVATVEKQNHGVGVLGLAPRHSHAMIAKK